MNTYEFHAKPQWLTQATHLVVPEITVSSLSEALTESTIKTLVANPRGGYSIVLEWKTGDHEEALNGIESYLGSIGYETAEILVTQWVDRAAQGLFVGALGGGALGAATKDGGITALGAIFGMIMGSIAGSGMREIQSQFNVRRQVYPFGWVATPVDISSSTGVDPGFYPA